MAYNYGLAPGTTHKVSPSGSSAAASTAFNADTVFVRIAASADMHIAFAATPTVTATVTGENTGSTKRVTIESVTTSSVTLGLVSGFGEQTANYIAVGKWQ